MLKLNNIKGLVLDIALSELAHVRRHLLKDQNDASGLNESDQCAYASIEKAGRLMATLVALEQAQQTSEYHILHDALEENGVDLEGMMPPEIREQIKRQREKDNVDTATDTATSADVSPDANGKVNFAVDPVAELAAAFRQAKNKHQC